MPTRQPDGNNNWIDNIGNALGSLWEAIVPALKKSMSFLWSIGEHLFGALGEGFQAVKGWITDKKDESPQHPPSAPPLHRTTPPITYSTFTPDITPFMSRTNERGRH